MKHKALIMHCDSGQDFFTLSCGNTLCYLTHRDGNLVEFHAAWINDLGSFVCRECKCTNTVEPLKRFRVSAIMECDLHLDIWSTDPDSAYDHGRDLDGGLFTEDQSGGSWKVTSAEQFTRFEYESWGDVTEKAEHHGFDLEKCEREMLNADTAHGIESDMCAIGDSLESAAIDHLLKIGIQPVLIES